MGVVEGTSEALLEVGADCALLVSDLSPPASLGELAQAPNRATEKIEATTTSKCRFTIPPVFFRDRIHRIAPVRCGEATLSHRPMPGFKGPWLITNRSRRCPAFRIVYIFHRESFFPVNPWMVGVRAHPSHTRNM